MTTSDRPPRQAAEQLRVALAQRVVVADGAMGTMLQASPVTLGDFDGHEGCNEILNHTRPDVVRLIDDAYLEAGVNCITTNTFGANLGNLGEYGLQARIEELSEAGRGSPARPPMPLAAAPPLGARLGRSRDQAAHPRPRPFRRSARLLPAQRGRPARGGVDAIVVETCQDLLQAKAAIIGARRAMAADGSDLPLIAHVTIETDRLHAARDRDRGGPHRPGAAWHQPDRAQLRDRPGGDERAFALPGGPRGRPGFLHAQRRPAGADR